MTTRRNPFLLTDTDRRMALLEPNESQFRIERDWTFSFPLASVVIGESAELFISEQPDVMTRPQRLTMNVPAESMFTLESFVIGNEIVIGGPVDAFAYATAGAIAQSRCAHCGAPFDGVLTHCRFCRTQYPPAPVARNSPTLLNCPTIWPSLRASFRMRYTGRCPSGYARGDAFSLSIALVGLRSVETGWGLKGDWARRW